MIVKGWEGMKRGDIKIRTFIKSVFVSEEAGWEGEAKREGSDLKNTITTNKQAMRAGAYDNSAYSS